MFVDAYAQVDVWVLLRVKTPQDIPKFADLYLEGKLPVGELISSIIEFDDINEAMDQLADGKAVRQVMIFE